MKNNKKRNIIIVVSVILIMLFICIGYILINNNLDNKDNNDLDSSLDSNVDVSKEINDLKKWLDENYSVIEYFNEFEHEYDINTSTKVDYSNILAWYLWGYGKLENPTDSRYIIKYISKDEAKNFLLSFINKDEIKAKDIDELIDLNLITNYSVYGLTDVSFSSDNNNYYVKYLIGGMDPLNTSVLDDIDISNLNNIILTYGFCGYLSECTSSDSYKGYRQLVLSKHDNGYSIISSKELAKN